MEELMKTEGSYMQAVITNPNATPGLVMRKVPMPIPAPNQALIKVAAFSLNQGETRTALAATTSYAPGWDFAGIVEKAAGDGSSPIAGAQVFGLVAQGAWAEYVIAPGAQMAEIPEGITYTQAASLPVAGATALTCLEVAGTLLDRRVLITGAAGGVGRLACQLAALAGAKVFAVSRRPDLLQRLQADGVEPAGVFTTLADAKTAGEYDVILDSVGGDTLATALTALARDGVCVNCGNSTRQPTTFNIGSSGWPFHRKRCIWIGRDPGSDYTPILTRLIGLVKQGRLHTSIDLELPWTKVAEAAERLTQQRVNGKIVLKVM